MGCSHGAKPMGCSLSGGQTKAETPGFEPILQVDEPDFPGQPSGAGETDPTIRSLRASVPQPRAWDEKRFQFVRKLQDANRNSGRVDLMKDSQDPNQRGGFPCAVKRMPNAWMTSCPTSFARTHPDSTERPWTDVAVVNHLNARGCPFVCELVGVFLDEEHSYVVASLASDGDLFTWSAESQLKGPAREAAVNRLMVQVFMAVQQLHNFGIAHRDISPENILLHSDAKAGQKTPQIKLCDFGMATVTRHCPAGEARGKHPYQSPEMHTSQTGYDAFLSDAFAIGVVSFSVVFQIYPWNFTKQGNCRRWDMAADMGVAEWLKVQKAPRQKSVNIPDVVSADFLKLLGGLLHVDPAKRWTLGEKCWQDPKEPPHLSVFDSKWV